MLAHQLPALPSFEQFWAELPEVLEWLHGAIEKAARQSISFGRVAIDETWQPPAMAQAWHKNAPLEKIRFAAANRLCVNLYYKDTYRLIQPYSLRRSKAGELLLFAIRHNTNEPRSYRVDRMQGAEVTNTSFIPKYAVELTPSGPISAPRLTRSSVGVLFPSPSVRRSRSIKATFGPIYVIECPFCGKKFNRKKMNTRLNKHKDKNGYPCSGRSGYLVDTKY